ncbi:MULTISPECIES: FxSxx-COOH system tetratricopeptide repeat protein [unclassified Frankia]|uniref:FxSxx-COOH system tetratricopeptide repeat protein n=1 Tax=unclassified Frankia TaxID=2632575 RepID=UPI002AD596ED|nr:MULTISPECIES: FxSxx-COOH system tetratricopeptide repeat protein [unclassified Frankia]
MTSDVSQFGSLDDSGVECDVLISYASADQLWAEWIMGRLQRRGRQVELHRLDHGSRESPETLLRGCLRRADRMIMILSDTYFSAGLRTHEAWSAAFTGIGDLLDRIIPVLTRTVNVPMLPRAKPLAFVDLTGVNEAEAHRRLLRLVPVDTDESLDDVPLLRGGRAYAATRYPGEPPSVSGNIPQRNPLFTGRDAELDAIREGFTDDIPVISLRGIGGVGKTQLATEYAYRFGSSYDLVWYVHAGTGTAARSDLAGLAYQLGLPFNNDLGKTARSVRDALSRGIPYRRWLLVFDAAESPDEICPLLPSGGGHILITARSELWRSFSRLMEIDVYTPDESIQFLCSRVAHLSRQDALRVADELDNLPLALDTAARFIAASRTPVDAFLDLADRDFLAIASQSPSSAYERSLLYAWLPSHNLLRERRPATLQLLRICSFLGSYPVPLRMFRSDDIDTGGHDARDLLPPELAAELADPVMRARILADLDHYALAVTGIDEKVGSAIHTVAPGMGNELGGKAKPGPTIHMHRVVQRVFRDLIPAEEREQIRRVAHSVLAAADPGNPSDPANWGRYLELLRHLQPSGALERHDSAQLCRLVLREMAYLIARGELISGRDLAADALGHWSSHLAADDPSIIFLRIQLSIILRYLGDNAQALAHSDAALTAASTTSGPGRYHRFDAAANHASALRFSGDFRAALPIDREDFESCSAEFGTDHVQTLTAAHNLAVSLRMNGLFGEALAVDRDTCDRWDRLIGPSQLASLFSANNVARDERECGLVHESLARQEQTVARYLTVLTLDDGDVLRARKNLALSLRKAGRRGDALELATDVLARHLRAWGPDNRETIAARTNLANDLRLAGDLVAARTNAEEALRRSTAAFGDRHPYTLGCAVNHAILLRLNGQVAEATTLDMQTLRRFQEVLGENHPYSLACLTNLASDFAAAGRSDDALAYSQRAYEAHRRARGERHPYTLACAANLAADFQSSGDAAVAEQLAKATAEAYAKTLGSAHPESQTAITARARMDLDIEPPPM